MASHERFGYEWERYDALHARYEDQFLNWVAPLAPADFAGARVLDAGCGMGRNSFWPLHYGAASVVAFDLDERSVAAAKRTLRAFDERADVRVHSIYAIPYKEQFDIVLSIGVVHHLDDPVAAVRQLYDALAPGGVLVMWVYSKEGNERILPALRVLRLVTARLPVSVVHAGAYLLSAPLWLALKLSGGWTPYLKQLATFDFWHVHSIVFDQLIPRVANYWTREQIGALLDEAGCREAATITRPPNQQGWTISVRRS